MSAPNVTQVNILKEEYKKCYADPVYFIKKYCKIQHPKKGRIPFELYPFQETTLHALRKNDYNIILKSRQLGISTLSSGYSLWLMLFHKDKNVLAIANKQDVAKNIVTKVREMYDSLPEWLKLESVENNKLTLRLKNGSQIKAVSSSSDSGRSEALSLLIIDEAAHIENLEDIWVAAQQTLATGGSAIILSTPNGPGNYFHKLWVEAEQGLNRFNTIKLKWDVHPDRDLNWRKKQDELLGAKNAAQECDADFTSSGAGVVDVDALKWYEDNTVLTPIKREGPENSIWIWKEPDYNKKYIVSADVARSDGDDYSAFHIIEIDNLEQVAECKLKISTRDFAHMLVNYATMYNDALLVIENANIGWSVIETVTLDRRYKNLYYSPRDTNSIIDIASGINKRLDLAPNSTKVPGFSVTVKSRPLLVDKFTHHMYSQSPVIRSARLILELTTFIWNGSKAVAQKGYNDDLIMSFMIAIWVRDVTLQIYHKGNDMTRSMLKYTSTSYNEFRGETALEQSGYLMRQPDGTTIDLRDFL